MEEKAHDPKMDPNDLWKEEVFTDRKIGTIRRMTPIKTDGSVDAGRKVTFVGEASLLTPAGSLPLSFEIEASDLSGAVAGFGDAVHQAFNDAMEELKDLRRRQSSGLVLPGQGGAGLPPGGLGGLPPGALPPGGKLKL